MNDEDMRLEAIESLAETFPSLRGAPGVSPWDALALNLWACRGASHGEKVTAQFILTVWNQHEAWECGRFDVMEALQVFDLNHRAAFLAWAQEPWWA
jgi:hypothetical protein